MTFRLKTRFRAALLNSALAGMGIWSRSLTSDERAEMLAWWQPKLLARKGITV